ncbi:MAG: hypothetical protein ABWY38_05945 [Methyloceanibacter sp.]
MLSEHKAAPFIVNFKMVDTDGNGKISQDEFKQGCKASLVQVASAEGKQAPTGSGSPRSRRNSLGGLGRPSHQGRP